MPKRSRGSDGASSKRFKRFARPPVRRRYAARKTRAMAKRRMRFRSRRRTSGMRRFNPGSGLLIRRPAQPYIDFAKLYAMQAKTTLNYLDTFSMNPFGITAISGALNPQNSSFTLNLSSLYDPLSSSTNTTGSRNGQPQFRDQLFNYFGSYQVVAAKVTCWFEHAEADRYSVTTIGTNLSPYQATDIALYSRQDGLVFDTLQDRVIVASVYHNGDASHNDEDDEEYYTMHPRYANRCVYRMSAEKTRLKISTFVRMRDVLPRTYTDIWTPKDSEPTDYVLFNVVVRGARDQTSASQPAMPLSAHVRVRYYVRLRDQDAQAVQS